MKSQVLHTAWQNWWSHRRIFKLVTLGSKSFLCVSSCSAPRPSQCPESRACIRSTCCSAEDATSTTVSSTVGWSSIVRLIQRSDWPKRALNLPGKALFLAPNPLATRLNAASENKGGKSGKKTWKEVAGTQREHNLAQGPVGPARTLEMLGRIQI